jgi:hypothetical protein
MLLHEKLFQVLSSPIYYAREIGKAGRAAVLLLFSPGLENLGAWRRRDDDYRFFCAGMVFFSNVRWNDWSSGPID